MSPAVVLDLMCGVGKVVLELNHMENIVAFGIDALSYSEWCSQPESFIWSDVKHLEYVRHASVDVVFNIYGIFEYLANPMAIHSEVMRILKPGGIGFYAPISRRQLAQILEAGGMRTIIPSKYHGGAIVIKNPARSGLLPQSLATQRVLNPEARQAICEI